MAISSATKGPSQPLAYLESDDVDGICHMILDRPSSRNALSRQMVRDIHACLTSLSDQFHQRSSVCTASSSLKIPPRVLIVQGRGPSFCAGADLVERGEMSSEEVLHFLKSLRSILDALQELPIPTIAAIDGPALGGGLELALACDFRYAGVSVKKIGFPEVTLGVIPGAGGTQRAPRVIGLQKAKELIFTGAPVTAQEAFKIGLVDRVVAEPSCLQDCRELARSMLLAAPLSLQSAKVAIMGGTELQLDQGLDLETACYEPLLDSRDRKEALLAFKEKRQPVFA